MRFYRLLLLLVLGFVPTQVLASLNICPAATDGVLSITSNTTIDLSLAITAAWNTANPIAGRGVYDAEKWAVVFKYDSVYVASGATVTFSNHPSGAPVVWLVNRGVKIQGNVNLAGTSGTRVGASFAAGGPGGFRGGIGMYWNGIGSPGFGPGGGQYSSTAPCAGGNGSYRNVGINGGPAYGNDRILPLIGGSGGAGAGCTGSQSGAGGGGGGGGAILIASNRTLSVLASGGYGGILTTGGSIASGGYNGGYGSGGAIRLIANAITGQSTNLNAMGGVGGSESQGRIRLECNGEPAMGNSSTPAYTSQNTVSETGDIWPSELPAVRVTYIGGQPAPPDPRASFNGPGDVLVTSPSGVEVVMEANNVPITDPATWTVSLRLAPTVGDDATTPQTAIMDPGGSTVLSIWRVTLPTLTVARCSAIQARAHKLP